MVGYSEMTEVMLWVQTTREADVLFRYWVSESTSKRSSSIVRTDKDDAYVARIRISDLVPGSRYAYELVVDGDVIERPYTLSFTTQSLWQWRTDPPPFTFAVGSCLYINEAAWDRPGKPYGSDYEILTVLADARPDAMVWLGDNTYYREVDWNTAAGLQHRWTHTRSVPELQPLLGSVHHYYLWDDHDYGPNDADRSYRLKEEALSNHILFTANQLYGTSKTPGTFSRFEWADTEFILLDDRYYRSPNFTNSDDPDKTMWGKEQFQWLKDVLLNSRAPFKVVMNGNQVLNPIVQHEGLARFKAEYAALMTFIKTNRIPGVLFVSGDRHMTELIRLDDDSFYPLYDFTSSSLTAGLARPRGPEADNPYRVPGTLVADQHTFGLLHVSGPRTDRVMTLECRDITGATRWKHTLRAKDLRPPNQ
jgi:alkaline phosphatase D